MCGEGEAGGGQRGCKEYPIRLYFYAIFELKGLAFTFRFAFTLYFELSHLLYLEFWSFESFQSFGVLKVLIQFEVNLNDGQFAGFIQSPGT